jgi:AcrR family transcriptional regulator
MAHALSAKGYGETTITDIVREAGVSRRTFYEHFATKAECLIALYEASSLHTLRVLRDAIDVQAPWDAQLENALSAYLGSMAANPALVRMLFIEILGLGLEGLAARRRVNQQIADFVLLVANASPARGQQALLPQLAMAVVGGINELVLTYIERDDASNLQELVGAAGTLVRAVILAENGSDVARPH